ncbi:MAG: hypothetical protein BWY15_01738 [Firmicutes bacterium ADurb.Bin193]|nr:MAG: hypothetical protein BWY15_01738 [Firmicutes bacterium ADurb.Bin193]
MAKIIVKIPYIKNKSAANYAAYIATRDGVDKSVNMDLKIAPPTEKQLKFIDEYIIKLPNAKELFEYEDYIKNPTIENASKFIAAATEQNPDSFQNREKYISYIATRPRAEKVCEHGLFGAADNVELEKVKNEIKNLSGNFWTPIISLRREDAERLGYDNAESWKNLLRAKQIEFSKALGIPLKDLRWYAAYHDEGYHPHCHMVIYSVNPKQGYLTKKGIVDIKSSLANEIFMQDLQQLYSEKTIRRDKVSDESREKIKELVDNINNRDYSTNEICQNLISLSDVLKTVKGKKQYGYLPKNIKIMVDDIVKDLADDELIAELYHEWCDIQNKIIATYKSDFIEHPPLWENKEFKKIRNTVITEALNISEAPDQVYDEPETESDLFSDASEADTENETASEKTKKPSAEPKQQRTAHTSFPAMAVFHLFVRLARMLGDSCDDNYMKHFSSEVDSKTMKKIAEKKAEQGLKF